MKYSLGINILLAQCWSVYALDQNIPASDENQRRVQETLSDFPAGVPVSYQCEFVNRWTRERHPNEYPTGAHWSPPLMASHSKRYTMWSGDQVSSAGVERVAETGQLSVLQTELDAAKPVVNDVGSSDGAFFPGGDLFSTSIRGTLDMDNSHRLISAITMVAPSPDWFTGLNSFRPTSGGKWLSSFTVDSFPWDAGSENGNDYSGSNTATNPKVNSFRLTVDTVSNVTKVFLNPAGDGVSPVAQWKCTLIPVSCRQSGGARFFRGRGEKRDRTQRCKWLRRKPERIDRFCPRTRSDGEDQPSFNLPLASEVCRVTCESCPTAPTAPTALPVVSPTNAPVVSPTVAPVAAPVSQDDD